MNRREAVLLLRSAAKAIRELQRTADAVVRHEKDCKVCSSRVRRAFYHCHDKDNIVFDFLVAKAEVDQNTPKLDQLRQDIQGVDPNAKVSAAWCEKLFKLEDTR
jgi:hypothetical protein